MTHADEPDLDILITSAVSDTPEGQQHPGSEVRWCSICATPIWLSQSGLERLDRNRKLKPMCAACGVPLAEEHRAKMTPIEGGMMPAELRQVAQYLKRTYGKKGR